MGSHDCLLLLVLHFCLLVVLCYPPFVHLFANVPQCRSGQGILPLLNVHSLYVQIVAHAPSAFRSSVCYLTGVEWLQPTLTDVTLVTKEEDLPEDLHAPNLKLFVCSINPALQRKVIDAADTLTTSLGPVRDVTYCSCYYFCREACTVAGSQTPREGCFMYKILSANPASLASQSIKARQDVGDMYRYPYCPS